MVYSYQVCLLDKVTERTHIFVAYFHSLLMPKLIPRSTVCYHVIDKKPFQFTTIVLILLPSDTNSAYHGLYCLKPHRLVSERSPCHTMIDPLLPLNGITSEVLTYDLERGEIFGLWYREGCRIGEVTIKFLTLAYLEVCPRHLFGFCIFFFLL